MFKLSLFVIGKHRSSSKPDGCMHPRFFSFSSEFISQRAPDSGYQYNYSCNKLLLQMLTSHVRLILGLQPRDKATMLVVNTK